MSDSDINILCFFIFQSIAVRNSDRDTFPKNFKFIFKLEDIKLFEYSKNELTNLANSGQPFNFNMLTADTHHIGGYPCSECEDL